MAVPTAAIVAPLTAVPMTLIVLYLKALRDHQFTRHAELLRRVERVEGAWNELRAAIGEFERDYATKEEWLRECLWTRRIVDRLTRSVARIETIIPMTARKRPRRFEAAAPAQTACDSSLSLPPTDEPSWPTGAKAN